MIYLLSPHFTYEELTVTAHRSLLRENRESGIAFRPTLSRLAVDILEPARELLGTPLAIHSGYRCEALNKAVKGSKTSQHMKGEAADFHPIGMPLEEAFNRLAASSIPFGQLILEGASGIPAWIHISLGFPFRAANLCNQVLTIDVASGKTIRLR